jgi:hypothetical protein
MNATVGGQTLLPNTTLFSGDSLQVKDGMAVVALGGASRMVFGHDTVASFLRDSNEVTVLLGQGNVSVFHDAGGLPVRMKIGNVSVVPVSGFKTLGEVAMLNGSVVVTSKEGTLRVEGNGQAINVAKGKTITVAPGANAPNGSGGSAGAGGRCCGGSNVWGIIGVGVGAGALIVGAIAISRADDAKNSANSSESAAQAAAAAASSAAAAAISAANSAASAALYNSIDVGCALNTLANNQDQSSPYTPPGSAVCNNPATW